MLTYLRTSIFESPAQTLVNTVNLVGVMGKGIAKEFKHRFPEMFDEYKRLCDLDKLQIGTLHLWRGGDVWVLNLPTKTTWRMPSKIEYVEMGLEKFVETYEKLGITSVSFPPLGCGNGNLEWSSVKPLLEKYLSKLPIPVYVHDRQVGKNFVPEHKEKDAQLPPATFDEFLSDLTVLVQEREGVFRTLTGAHQFVLKMNSACLHVNAPGRSGNIPIDDIETAWSAMQSGVLSVDQYSNESSRRTKPYLFALLSELPYVRVSEIERHRGEATTSAHGLLFVRDAKSCPEKLELFSQMPRISARIV